MSVGKIVRKIVRKWLKKEEEEESESGEVEEPHEYEIFSESVSSSSAVIFSEPPCHERCMFYANADDGRCPHGDLNRNVHISDDIRFSSNCVGAKEECQMRRCTHPDVVSHLHPIAGPLQRLVAAADYTDVSVEAIYESSQSPVPVCVCEACYIVVSSHLSLRLPSTFPSQAAVVTGRSFCDSGSKCWPHACPAGSARLLLFSDNSVKSSETTTMDSSASLQVATKLNCNKNGSAMPHLKRPNHHHHHHHRPSPLSPKSSQGTDQLRPVASAYHSNTHLPPPVHISMDGEEGFRQSQRRLQFENHCHGLERKSFCPPPNKTICHVAK